MSEFFEMPWAICSTPGSSIHGTFYGMLKWVAISFSRGSFWPRDWTWVSCIFCICRWILYHCTTWEAQLISAAAAAAAKSLQSCQTLCDPIDGSTPGSPVPRILQARALERVAISFCNAWKWKLKVMLLSRVWLLATPSTAAYQAPLPMGFSRQEYWSGLPLLSLKWSLEFFKICSALHMWRIRCVLELLSWRFLKVHWTEIFCFQPESQQPPQLLNCG